MAKGIYKHKPNQGFQLGHKSGMTGKRHSKKTIEKMSETKQKSVKEGTFKSPCYWTGKKLPKKTKIKMSEIRKNLFKEGKIKEYSHWTGKKHSEDTKRKMRESAIKYIERTLVNGEVIRPNVGRNESLILDLIEKVHNVNILRQFGVTGYFLDGYIPELNLAVEVDESYHNNPEQLQKDKYREEQIKKELGCSFFRILV